MVRLSKAEEVETFKNPCEVEVWKAFHEERLGLALKE